MCCWKKEDLLYHLNVENCRKDIVVVGRTKIEVQNLKALISLIVLYLVA